MQNIGLHLVKMLFNRGIHCLSLYTHTDTAKVGSVYVETELDIALETGSA